MSHQHTFLFEPGNWIGEGTVAFSASPQKLYFVTNWDVSALADEAISCLQEVKMESIDEPNHNSFVISGITESSFAISIENETIGHVVGKGVIDEKTIAWEFNGHLTFQGYEVYERQENGEYSFHAEYSAPDQFRTIIDGRIRRQ